MRTVLQLVIAVLLLGAAAGGAYWLDRADPGAAEEEARDGAGRETAVDVAPVRLEQVRDTFEATGTTRALEQVNVVTETSGRITRIAFEEGDEVARGDVLIELDTESQRAELREAEARARDARAQFERARDLRADTGAVSQQEVDTLEASLAVADARVGLAETRLRDRIVRAPFDGVVGLRDVSLGAYVDPQTRITTLDDADTLRLGFSVPERFMGSISPGMPAVAEARGFPGERFEVEVRRIDTRVDPVTRTLRVESEIENDGRRMRPGMFMTVRLVLDQRESTVIPEEALILEGDDRYVYVVRDAEAVRVDVETGTRTRGSVEVRSGLEVEDRVVTLGHQKIRDGDAVDVRRVQDAETAGGEPPAAAWRGGD